VIRAFVRNFTRFVRKGESMEINKKHSSGVITDLQNDFLSEKRAMWGLGGDSVEENKTLESIERIVRRYSNRR
jgi:hypothetical protein